MSDTTDWILAARKTLLTFKESQRETNNVYI